NAFTALAAIVRQLIAWSLCHGIPWSTSPEYQGRPWTDKAGKKSYFNSLHLWKINILGAGTAPQHVAPAADISSSGDDDDLPF
nr:hypothetical protein [Mucilaginibacter sp. SP1R1]